MKVQYGRCEFEVKRPKKLDFKVITIALLALIALAGCGSSAFAGVDGEISHKVGQQNQWYYQNQPFHFYPFSAPRELEIQLEDIIIPKLGTTWTVISAPGMGPVDSCESRGYGLPYGVELTNTMYAKEFSGNSSVTLPQPDTDGLYKDGITTQQTVVLCNRNNQWVAEVHENNCDIYSTPVHLELMADKVHFRIVHDPGTASSTVDVNAINQKSEKQGGPSTNFPNN